MPYIIDGKPVEIADEPRNQDGTLWVPLRALGEAVGAKVEWDQSTKQIALTHKKGDILLDIGSKDVNLNGNVVNVQAAPFVDAGETWVPVRFFNEVLGYALNVNLAENLVELTTWNG